MHISEKYILGEDKMGFFDAFKGKQYKNEAEELRTEVERLNALLTPEMKQASNIQKHIAELQAKSNEIDSEIAEKMQEFQSLKQKPKKLI